MSKNIPVRSSNKTKQMNAILLILLAIMLITDWPLIANVGNFPMGTRHLALFASFFILALVSRRKLIPKTYSIICMIMIIWALFGVSTAKNGMNAYLLGFVFTYFFALIHVMGYMYKAKNADILIYLKYFVFIVFFLSLPPFFTGLVNGTNLRWLPGIFRELGAFAAMMNIALIASITLFAVTKKNMYVYFVIFFIVCISMTVLKKSIVEFLIIVTFAGLFITKQSFNAKIKYFTGLTFFMLVIGFLSFNQLQDNLIENADYLRRAGVEGHVRLGMYIAGYSIALDNFPYGSGYGSFGSLASISLGYSPVYSTYGVDVIGANSPQDVANGHHTLLDTFWPHILGEAGFIGSLIYILIYVFPMIKSYRLIGSIELNRPYAFFIISTIGVILLDGIALYTPEVPIFIMLSSGFCGIILRRMKENLRFEESKLL